MYRCQEKMPGQRPLDGNFRRFMVNTVESIADPKQTP